MDDELHIDATATEAQQRLLSRAAMIGGRRKAPRRDLLAAHPLRDDPTALRVYLADYYWRDTRQYGLVVTSAETTLAHLALATATALRCGGMHLWEMFIPHPEAHLRNRGREFLALRGLSAPPPHNTREHVCPNCMHFGYTCGSGFPGDDSALGPADLEAAALDRCTTVATSAGDLLARDDWAGVVETMAAGSRVWEQVEIYPHPVSSEALVSGFPVGLPFTWKYNLWATYPGLLRAVDLLDSANFEELLDGQLPGNSAAVFSVVDGHITMNPEEDEPV